jgi:hypothetical protein
MIVLLKQENVMKNFVEEPWLFSGNLENDMQVILDKTFGRRCWDNYAKQDVQRNMYAEVLHKANSGASTVLLPSITVHRST